MTIAETCTRPVGSFSILTLPGDRKTWSVTLFVSGRDRPLKVVKDADRWEAVVAACVARGLGVRGIELSGKSLESIFRELTAEDGRSEGTEPSGGTPAAEQDQEPS